MKESEAIKKAIRHFECMKNDAVVVLNSGFGTHPGESDSVYRNRKMYAELAINALEKQIPKKVIKWANGTEHCPACDCDNSCVGYGVCIDCGQKLDWSEEE